MFVRKVFTSHYCNIPYHLLDSDVNRIVNEKGTYPKTVIEELYAASFHLIRNFELAPYASNTSLEELIAEKINTGKL